MSADDAIHHLESFFASCPNAEKYYVDLSGQGEPLLNLQTVLRISDWCRKKQDELRKEVLPRLVTNGLLLTPKIAKALQNHGILFGVSIDGTKLIHDKHRIDLAGNPTFDTILNNVSKIENRDYIGCAVTLTKDVFSLVDALNCLRSYFKTISVRPARGKFSFDKTSLENWLSEYDKLTVYLADRLKFGDTTLLKALINGEDYLGTFLGNMLIRKKKLTRCDAHISRYTIDMDGRIGGCSPELSSAATFHDGEILNAAMMQCSGCDFKFFCGGICPIEKDETSMEIECEFQRHLVLLSAYLIEEIMCYPDVFEDLRKLAFEKHQRNRIDPELKLFLDRHREYSFTEGKKIFDEAKQRY